MKTIPARVYACLFPDDALYEEEALAKALLNVRQDRPVRAENVGPLDILTLLLEKGWVAQNSLTEIGTGVVPTVRGDTLVYASTQLVPMMKRWRSADESNLSDDRTDHYKPIYGSMSILVAPAYLEKMGLGGQAAPFTKEESFLIARMAHPYFIRALREDREGFSSTYDFIYEAWY